MGVPPTACANIAAAGRRAHCGRTVARPTFRCPFFFGVHGVLLHRGGIRFSDVVQTQLGAVQRAVCSCLRARRGD
eukprot:3419536-Rhodomonas_salina.1